MPDRKYNVNVTTKSISGFIDVVPKCIGFMFTNIGTAIADVNGMVIFPSAAPATTLGDSRSIGANKDEVFIGTLKLTLRAPLGANPLVEIVQIFYTE